MEKIVHGISKCIGEYEFGFISCMNIAVIEITIIKLNHTYPLLLCDLVPFLDNKTIVPKINAIRPGKACDESIRVSFIST